MSDKKRITAAGQGFLGQIYNRPNAIQGSMETTPLPENIHPEEGWQPGFTPILTANMDQLASDALAIDPMSTTYDPQGVAAGKSVPNYIKEWGIALNPVDQASAFQYHNDVMEPVRENEGILQTYKDDFDKAIKEYDKKLKEEVEARTRDAVGGVSDDQRGNWRGMKHDRPRYTEAEYEQAKEWARLYEKGGEDALFNSIDGLKSGAMRGGPRTKPWHDHREHVLTTAKHFLRERDTDKKLQKTITSGQELRDASVEEFEHNVTEAEGIIEEQRAPWDLWLQNQQKLFKQGVESNTASITGLVESGALQFKGSVKK